MTYDVKKNLINFCIFISMIIIQVQKGESIDKALKRYKFKVSKTRQMEKLRNRQEFTKKSVEKPRSNYQKIIHSEAWFTQMQRHVPHS